jgi:hypothetical protein
MGWTNRGSNFDSFLSKNDQAQLHIQWVLGYFSGRKAAVA